MRKRLEIEQDHHSYEVLSLEVLLDLRELLSKAKPRKEREKRKKKVIKKKSNEDMRGTI
jgi:hypothetical protein